MQAHVLGPEESLVCFLSFPTLLPQRVTSEEGNTEGAGPGSERSDSSECLESKTQLTNEVLERLGSQRRENTGRLLKKLIFPCACVRLFLLLHLHDSYSSGKENKTREKFGLCGSRSAQCTLTSGYCIRAHICAPTYSCMPVCLHKMPGGGYWAGLE